MVTNSRGRGLCECCTVYHWLLLAALWRGLKAAWPRPLREKHKCCWIALLLENVFTNDHLPPSEECRGCVETKREMVKCALPCHRSSFVWLFWLFEGLPLQAETVDQKLFSQNVSETLCVPNSQTCKPLHVCRMSISGRIDTSQPLSLPLWQHFSDDTEVLL